MRHVAVETLRCQLLMQSVQPGTPCMRHNALHHTEIFEFAAVAICRAMRYRPLRFSLLFMLTRFGPGELSWCHQPV